MKIENESQNSSLESFYGDLSQNDKDILDDEIFNPHGIPVETMTNIEDTEVARRVMGRLKQYLEWKEQGMSREDLKKSAADFVNYYNNQFQQTEQRKAA